MTVYFFYFFAKYDSSDECQDSQSSKLEYFVCRLNIVFLLQKIVISVDFNILNPLRPGNASGHIFRAIVHNSERC